MFSLLEALIKEHQSSTSQLFEQVKQKVQSSVELFKQVGFEPICFEDFVETFTEKLDQTKEISISDLEIQFEDKMLSDSLVMYARLLTSAYLRVNQDRFFGFVEGYGSIEDFCKAEVDPMDKECEQLQVIAITEAINLRVLIEYLDRSSSEECETLVFPESYEGVNFQIPLLYRPGHYDLLYPN